MDVSNAISTRRAYRALETIEITDAIVNELASAAQMAPSCFNYQPWHFVFVREKEKLQQLHSVVTKNNNWAKTAPMIVCVAAKKESDCVIKEREYYLFDTGMATAFLMLRATELGLVAHPIAGFDEEKAKLITGIPMDYRLAVMIIVGKHSADFSGLLTPAQAEIEKKRPQRKPLNEFALMENFVQNNNKGEK